MSTPPVGRPGILARGPWQPGQVDVSWIEDAYEPPRELDRLADEAVAPSASGARPRTTAWPPGSPRSTSTRAA